MSISYSVSAPRGIFGLVRGILLPPVLTMQPSARAEPPPPPPLKPILELRHFDVLQLNELDSVRQTFKATIFIQFSITGGAKVEGLNTRQEYDPNGRVKFPIDEDGRPTFRPPAAWYLDQLLVRNSQERGAVHVLESKAYRDGDDLVLQKRFEGEFIEPLEIVDFPCDEQALHIALVLACRNEGQVPVEIIAKDAQTSIQPSGYHLRQGWKLKAAPKQIELTVDEHNGGHHRTFPLLTAVLTVRRRPTFFVFNVAAPMAIFSGLALLQFRVHPDEVSDRLSISLTLLLTIAAYQGMATSLTPKVAYLTALDRYRLLSSALNAQAPSVG